MRALASSDSRATRAMRVASIASCARRRPSAAADRSAATRSDSIANVVDLDVELRERLGDAVARRGRVLERVAQRRGGIDRGKHFAARRLDVGLEPFDFAVRRFVRVRLGGECLSARSRSNAASAAALRRAASSGRAGSRRASSVSSSAATTVFPRVEASESARGRTRSAAAGG